ncbi:MAG: hypothetical protein ACJA2W_000282 [Planctomycetota bacterium]|jgi:hypothetical protein
MDSNGEWGRALALIQSEHRRGDVESCVVRVEARRDGSQVWALDGDVGRLWYIYQDGELRRARPSDDRKLPGAAELVPDGLLAWRPGRRAVTADPDGASIWKLFRAKRLKDAVLRHELALAGCSGTAHWRVPHILRVDEAKARIQFERVHGRELPVLRRESSAWRRVGLGLSEFQRAVDVSGLPYHGRREELDVIVQLHQRYAALFGTELAGVDELLERLGAWALRGGPSDPPVAVHRDLHDGQFVYSDGAITVLDFDQLCAGEAEVDLANLSSHLVLRQLQDATNVGEDDVRECALALLSGFGIDDHNDAVNALRFYQAATFTRLAILYSFRPKWRSLREALIRHAVVSLDDLCHA